MYLVAAWILLQFGEVMIDLMELPLWIGRAIVGLLALGFPFVLILAWVFDVTAGGIVRTDEVDVPEIDRYKGSRKIDTAIIVVLALGLGASFYLYDTTDGFAPMNLGDSEEADSIAAETRQYLLVGNLVDFTGASANSGQAYGQAVIDSVNWINENGGINGRLIDLDTIETSYLVRRALTAYEKWQTQDILAIHGWGTQIGQALQEDISNDETPYFSASYAASFTDPTGKRDGNQPAPYTFFYGPSYSDACRGLVQWAYSDWENRGNPGKPTFVHMGDSHPYPNAPKKACAEYAEELGFENAPAIQFSLIPGDFSPQCNALKRSGAQYAFLANLDKSVTSLLKQCHDLDVDVQFMVNIWGFDEGVMQAAGVAADGVVWVMGAAKWNDDAEGMYTVREVSKMSDPEETKYRSVHYMRGVCSMFYLKEAMEIAGQKGRITGPLIKAAMYEKSDWVPAGLDGICLPASWTEQDHRGVTQVLVYQGEVNGPTISKTVDELISSQLIVMKHIYTAEIPRRPEWLGY